MSYSYEEQRPEVFTEAGQLVFLKVRDLMYHHCKLSGAVDWNSATKGVGGGSWLQSACIDRLIEIGEFELAYDPGVTQYRIYIKT